MLPRDLIESFLAQPIIAVTGVSRNDDNSANHIYRRFKEADYVVFPVNPLADEVEGDKCFHRLKDLPLAPSAVMMASTPDASLATMRACIELNVPLVWMHSGIGQGSYSEEAAELGRAHGIKVIDQGCPLMFIGKVDLFHKVLRWIKD